jgi:DNA-binding MarR family transcriptional regulator
MSPTLSPSLGAAEALIGVAPLVTRWIERLLAAHEPPLSVAQHLALRAVARPGASGRAMARAAGVSEAAASQLLSNLERAGLIARAPAPGDRRRQALALTPAGRGVLTSADAMLQARIGDLLGPLPRPEAAALERLLGRVAEALGGTAPPRRPPPPHPPGPKPRRPSGPPDSLRFAGPDRETH